MKKITVTSERSPHIGEYRIEDYEDFVTYVVQTEELQNAWRTKHLPFRFRLAEKSEYQRRLLATIHNDNVRKGNYSFCFKEEQ